MAYEDSSSVHDEPWIQWFCGLKGNEMFCHVERSYIEDGFNLYGLRGCVPNFSDCLDLILDRIGPDDSDDSHLTQSACTLYGLIHARYIITAHGLDAMYSKYAGNEFGTCPLIQCNNQPVLPVGLKDEVGLDSVKIFCPKCQCVYEPPPIRGRNGLHSASGAVTIDGSSFGTTFPHLFLMTFSNLVPDPLPADSAYTPRVFGFRLHTTAHQRSGSTPLFPPSGRRAAAAQVPPIEDGTANNNNGTGNADTEIAKGADAGASDTQPLDKGIEQKDATAASQAPTAGALTQVSNGSSKETQSKKGNKGKKGANTKDDGGLTKRKGKGTGDNDTVHSTKSKRQKRPH